MRIVFAVLVTGLAGLVVGYLLFGSVGGRPIEIARLLQAPSGIARVGQRLLGIEGARQRILAAGGIGCLVGLAAALATRAKR